MGSNSSTRFAGFWQNTDACAVERSGASCGCEAGKQPVELCQHGLAGDCGWPAHRQEFRRHPRLDLQVVGGCRPVEARSCAFQTEAACLEAQSPRQEGRAHERGSFRAGAATDADGFLVVADSAAGATLSGPASRRRAVEGLSFAGGSTARKSPCPTGKRWPKLSAPAATADGDDALRRECSCWRFRNAGCRGVTN